MAWKVEFDEAFAAEFDELPEAVQDELLAHARLLEEFGPQLKRPRADTLNGSRHANLKELRFDADDGVWRVAYAFDPRRAGILLVAGDKSGGSEKRFYRRLIKRADERFDAHLAALKEKGGKNDDLIKAENGGTQPGAPKEGQGPRSGTDRRGNDSPRP